MEVEIIFSGLCSFLNVDNKDPDIVEPSVILVQTDQCKELDCTTMHDPAEGDDKHRHMHRHGDGDDDAPTDDAVDGEADDADSGGNGDDDMRHKSHRHIPFIAFDTEQVKVDNRTGFFPVPDAPTFLYMPLDGVELKLVGDEAGYPQIDPSYASVVKKDDYWPEAKGKYNSEYVPGPGCKPKKSAVKAFLRFGKGKLSAGIKSRAAWAFLDGSEVKLCGLYAEEVIYSGFKHHDGQVVIELRDLETDCIIRTLHFSSARRGCMVTLFIGNHTIEDMDNAVRREPFDAFISPDAGTHWAFLNQICGYGAGPLPKPLAIPYPKRRAVGGGGPTGGPCGPHG